MLNILWYPQTCIFVKLILPVGNWYFHKVGLLILKQVDDVIIWFWGLVIIIDNKSLVWGDHEDYAEDIESLVVPVLIRHVHEHGIVLSNGTHRHLLQPLNQSGIQASPHSLDAGQLGLLSPNSHFREALHALFDFWSHLFPAYALDELHIPCA